MQDMTLFIVVGTVAVALLAGIAIGRRGRGGRDLMAPPAGLGRPDASRSAAIPASALPPALRADVDAALAQGQKIEAIRLVREGTRLSLREAKALVEALEEGG